MGRTPLTIEIFQEIAKSRGGKCLTKEYINVKQMLLFICENGHEFPMRGRHVRAGHWCGYCVGRYQSIEIYKEIARKKGGECLSDEYVNARTPIKMECAEGHEWNPLPMYIKRGHWCPVCCGQRKTIIDIKKLVEAKGGRLLSEEYHNAKEKLQVICENGHEWPINSNNLKTGKWCPICKEKLGERESRKIFEKLFGKRFPLKKPKWLQGLELDGYNEELGLAFEYNGEQHYELHYFNKNNPDVLEKIKKRDRQKHRICKEKRIKLIAIPYTEYGHLEKFILSELQKNGVAISSD